MRESFISLCSEISRENAQVLACWLCDEQVNQYMQDDAHTAAQIIRLLEKVRLPQLTHLLNPDGSLYIIQDCREEPVGFLRLIFRDNEIEIILAIGERSRWGKGLGRAALREGLKLAFFKSRTPKVAAVIHKENRRSVRLFTGAGFQIEREMHRFRRYTLTLDVFLRKCKENKPMSNAITLTKLDRERLNKILADFSWQTTREDGSLRDLRGEIQRAVVVNEKEVPPAIVTMNTRTLLNVNGRNMEVSLVYPHEADWAQNKLSVLSPIGTAILGYREGDEIKWEVPSGISVIRIKKVLYQPEAAGDYHL